jgi:GH24 family phage-related lysozyme (muramidase)
MAVNQLPLNNFKTVTAVLETNELTIYTVPAGITAIVLGAQCANVISTTATTTIKVSKQGTDTELLKDFAIPTGDAANLISGKLVLEEGSFLKALTDTNLGLKITLSILETSNE